MRKVAEESDITNKDSDASSFDIGQVLEWMDASENSEPQAKNQVAQDENSDENSDESRLYGNLGDLVNSTQVETVISDMGFDVDKLDELDQDVFLGEQEKVDDGAPKEFGDGYSTIGIRISGDGQKATLESLQLGDVNQPPSVAELKEVIKSNYGATHGWEDSAISEAIATAQKRAIWDGKIIVALATMPAKAADGYVVYHFLEKEENKTPIDGSALFKAMDGDDIKAPLRIKDSPILVAPGTKIATVVTPQSGKPGLNVYGQEIINAGKLANRPIAGKGVHLEDDIYTAECLGYVCLVDNRLLILSPLWIDEDRCGARFLYFPQSSSNTIITTSNLMELLQEENISFGIVESAVEKLCGDGGGSKRAAIAIARGRRRVVGKNAEFIPRVGTDDSKEQAKNGSIDYRNKNEYIPVVQGDLVGEFTPATKGMEGTTIYGEELPSSDGVTIQFTVGSGVQVKLKDEKFEVEEESPSSAQDDSNSSDKLIEGQHCYFYSKIMGSVRYTAETLEVLPVVIIAGDVDLSVGHVSTKGDVKIGGSVQFGFNVTCGGSVEIAGGVENGVTIRAEGDVQVNKSIVGEKTRIISGGDVSARLVHNARVVAQGDVSISHSLVNARISSGSTVTVTPGNGRVGSIVGGEIYASRFIQAKALGSPGMEPTRVGCRPSPQDLADLVKLRQELANTKKIVAKCMKWMGINKFDKRQIDRAFQIVTSDKREAFAKALQEGVRAAARLSTLPEDISKTTSEHQEIINKGQVRATEVFFAEVVVEFGIRENRLLDKNVGGRYVLVDDEVRWRPPI